MIDSAILLVQVSPRSIFQARLAASLGVRSLFCALVAIGALFMCHGVRAASGNTQAAVPTSSGNDVKSGDIIFWTVNKDVVVVSSAAPKAVTVDTTLKERAAAAAAVATAAHAAVAAFAARLPASNASQAAWDAFLSQLRVLDEVANKADAEADAAKQATAAVPQVDQTTGAAAADLVNAATQAVIQAQTASDAANRQWQSDVDAAAAAKNADKTLNDKANASGKAASQKALDLREAVARLNAANAALKDVTAKAAAASSKVSSPASKLCFPKGSLFQVTSVLPATESPKAQSPASGTGSTTGATQLPDPTSLIVSGHFPSDFYYRFLHPFHYNSKAKFDQAQNDHACGNDGPDVAILDKTYDFTADKLAKQDGFRGGFTWGGLVVPYKFYFKDRSIKSNSSIVGFAGWEGWFPGLSVSTIVALGGGTAPSAPAAAQSTGSSSNTSTSSTLVTYTAAAGFILAFGDSKNVKAGLIFGRDYQGNAATFAYENKTWMALSIGAGF